MDLRAFARYMDHGFAAGYITRCGDLVPGAQPPLIDADIWQAYCTRRAATRNRPRQAPDDFLVAGFAHCACGGWMSAVSPKLPRYSHYQCRKHVRGRPGESMLRSRLDGMVQTWLTALGSEPAIRDRAEADAHEWAHQQAQHAADIRGQLSDNAVTADERQQLLDRLDHVRAATAVVPSPGATAVALLEDWKLLDGLGRRRRLGAIIERVTVENVRPTPLLHITTRWASVTTWTGVQAGRQPSAERLPTASPTGGKRLSGDGPDPRELLTPAEAARITGVKVHTLRSWDVAGHLPHTRSAPDGGDRRYAIQDLRYMKSRYKTNGVWIAL